MGDEIRILTVENSPADLNLILEQLDNDGLKYSSLNVETKDEFIKGVDNYKPDIILTDYSLPEFNAISAIELIKDLSPLTPVIIVTGSNNESIAVECMKKGAEDYILKNNIFRIGFAIKGALENKKLKEEKELYEKKVLKLNRTYAFIGQINEMIVRSRDREKLFEDACKIGVETGKYRLVWIGLVDEINKIIRPYIWNGFEDGFLEEIKKMSDDDILRNDPIQNRILMGSYFVCNNIIEEDSGFILRKNGLAHGFHSLISLPLIVQTKVIGSLNIYADEPDFINDDEIKLLIEVAADISYALENISNEKEISLSELRYRRLFESAKDGIIILNAETGEIVDVNPFITSNLDYLKEDLIGKHLWEIGFLKDSIFNKDSFLELLEHDYIRYEDLPLRKKDGTSMDVEFVSNVYLADNVKVIQCNIRDITERKRSDKALLNSEFLLNIVMQNIPNLIWLKDIDGGYLSCNKMFERYFGAAKNEILGKTDYDFVDKEIADNFREHDRDAIAAGKPISFEEVITFADDGHIATIDTIKTPVYNTQSKLIGVLGIARDITERVKREKDLLKLSRAVENSSASIVMTNFNGDIEYVNQKFCDLTGYTIEEAIGKNPRIMNSGYHDKLFYENLWDTLLAGNNWNGEILNKKKNGDLYWESALISPLLNKDGDITDFVAIKEDITGKKNMISALIDAKEKAESANKLKDAFIANISHEIRTPLNGILGMTSLIREIFPGEIKKEDEELFEGIDYSSQRLIRTVDLILNYSRLQVGEYPLFPKKIELASICQSMVKEFTFQANNKSIELSFQNKSENTTLMADESSIVMAISNLIENAIKFSNKGIIKLILYKNNNNEIILDVIDTGVGISDEYLDKIFEPYLQEQNGYCRSYDGVGLGLALVKKVLDLNGASISVKSKKEKGSTFSINFGKAVEPASGKLKSRLIPNIPSLIERPIRELILIVEDDVLNQRIITRFIENNYNSIITNSSEIALDILQNKKIDLILMDISIKGDKNGLELTKDLKSSKEFSNIPIIAITAHAFELDKQNALASGCDNYLAKPFTQKELLQMMGLYLHPA